MGFPLKKIEGNLLIMLFLCNIFTSFFIYSPQASSKESDVYQQVLTLPFDFDNVPSDDLSYQPMDLFVEFDHPCWAKNETENSIQIFCKNNQDVVEIESQIYQLNRIDEQFISACQVVFILPEGVTKSHKFEVHYSDNPIKRTKYLDHLNVKKAHYHYEPISGQVLDIDYYSIIQDGIIPYAVSYRGSVFGNGVSQVIARLKPNSTILDTTRIDQFASFSMMASYDYDSETSYIGSGFCTQPKTTILLDGNLLIKIKIESVSPEGFIKTSNIYSYYYNPGEPNRIYVNCTHEILKNFELNKDYVFDGVYAYLLSFHSKSESIEKINMGTIFPELYLYGKDDRVHSYDIPVNPQSEDLEMILDSTDDVDLGSEAWMCIHKPEGMKTHGLLFSRNNSLTNSDQDGIAVKAFVEETLNLPGLEADTGSVFATQNHYDAGGAEQLTFEKGFLATYDVSFITFQHGAWRDVANESIIYRNLIKSQKNNFESDEIGCDSEPTYTVEGRVTGVNSFPLGSTLSAFTGKNFSYISAELYKNNKLFSSTIVSRLPFQTVSTDINLSSIKQIFNFVRTLIDWKNSSFFRRFRFTDIPPGDYLLKIYKENSLFSTSKIFIGYAIVKVESNTEININCRKPVSFSVTTIDQKNNPLTDVTVQMQVDDEIIVEDTTNNSGSISVSFPPYFSNIYNMQIVYKQIPIEKKKISPSLIHYLIPQRETFQIKLHDVTVTVLDNWQLAPAIQLQPELIYTNELGKKSIITALKQNEKIYEFFNIPEETYTLYLSYKGFDHSQKLIIDQDRDLSIQFPLTYETKIELYNQLGLSLDEATVTFSRNQVEKTYQLSQKTLVQNLPPGTYHITVESDGSCIAKKTLTILSDNHQRIVTIKESILPTIGYVISIVLIIGSVFIGFIRRQHYQGFLLLYAGFILLGALSPWWFFSGENSHVTVETRLHLLPTQMISFSETTETLGGQFSTLPSDAVLGLKILLVLLILSFCLLFIIQFFKQKYAKIKWSLYLGCIALQLIFLGGFLFIVSQLTILGVGSSVGKGSIQYNILDTTQSVQLTSSWGFGLGFFIYLIAFCIILTYPLLIKQIKESNLPLKNK